MTDRLADDETDRSVKPGNEQRVNHTVSCQSSCRLKPSDEHRGHATPTQRATLPRPAGNVSALYTAVSGAYDQLLHGLSYHLRDTNTSTC